MEKPDFLSTFSTKRTRPIVPICPITLLPALYKNPANGIPYRNIAAFRKLKENPPLWTKGPIIIPPFVEAKKVMEQDNFNLLKMLEEKENKKRK